MLSPVRVAAVGVAAAALLLFTASANTLSPIGDSSGPGVIDTGTDGVTFNLIPAATIGNDNTADGMDNVVELTSVFGAEGYVDRVFQTAESAATEYRFNNVMVNNSGQTWTSVMIEIGTGFGDSFRALTAVDIDLPDLDPAPTSAAFTTFVQSGVSGLIFSNGSLASGDQALFSFSVDLGQFPDGPVTLRQTPNAPLADSTSMPIPTSALLMVMGVTALAFRMRKRRETTA